MTDNSKRFSLGVDYGTGSVRAVIVDLETGEEVSASTYEYRCGKDGVVVDPQDPLFARQDPAEYVAGFFETVSDAVQKAAVEGFKPEQLAGIGTDATGSTPIPVDRHGTALAMLPEFKDNPAAMAWLWKDHTSHEEAARITEAAKKHGEKYPSENFLAKCGGTYSSEWYWSKILRCKKIAPKIFEAAYSWVEQADFIPGFLTGTTDPDTMPRGICAAGHKGLYHENWGGFPSEEFWHGIDKDLVPLRNRFASKMQTADQVAGGLTEEIARKVGLLPGTPVAVGAIDAHLGAVGAGIKPGTLVKIMGTSTCDMMVHPLDETLADIPGVCGIVPGSILPNMYGIEAGQSAVGDLFNWFCGNLVPEKFTKSGDVHENLGREAEKLRPGESGLLALDWNNGNRCVLTDPLLTGLLVGQTLHTTAPEIYRTLIEATAFGALMIIDRIEQYGVTVREVVNCGGIATKSPLTMQIYADICNRPMKVSASPQTCALGAAIMGAVAGKAFADVPAAQRKMTGTLPKIYEPNKRAAAVYAELFELYRKLHDDFGTKTYAENLFDVMKKLIEIRNRNPEATT